MKKLLVSFVMAIAFAAPTVGVALELDPRSVGDADGVVTQCVLLTKKKFATAMCDRLVGAAQSLAAKGDVPIEHLGTADWNDGDHTFLVPAGGGDIERPLMLTFYLRGTDGNPAGALAWASLYVAVDEPRPGRLEVWEGSTLGSGPPQPLAGAVADRVASYLEPVFAVISAEMAK